MVQKALNRPYFPLQRITASFSDKSFIIAQICALIPEIRYSHEVSVFTSPLQNLQVAFQNPRAFPWRRESSRQGRRKWKRDTSFLNRWLLGLVAGCLSHLGSFPQLGFLFLVAFHLSRFSPWASRKISSSLSFNFWKLLVSTFALLCGSIESWGLVLDSLYLSSNSWLMLLSTHITSSTCIISLGPSSLYLVEPLVLKFFHMYWPWSDFCTSLNVFLLS